MTGPDYRLTDEEWRAFQAIPDQGYSHRAWIDERIRQRAERAWDQGWITDSENFMDNPYGPASVSKAADS